MRRAFALLALLPSLAHAQWATQGVLVRDEGTDKGYAKSVNCTGAGVSCTTDGFTWTLNVAGGGGGGAGLPVDPDPCPAGQFVTDQDGSGALTCTAVGWGVVTGKPTTFAPSAHTHPGSDVTTPVANATAAAGLSGTTGAASSATYLRGDWTWSGVPSGALPVGVGSELQIRATGTTFGAYSGGDCAASNWMHGFDSAGAKNCTRPAFSDLSSSLTLGQMPTGTGYLKGAGGTPSYTASVAGGDVSGAVATASALASAPTVCGAGQAAQGIVASGNATGCFTPVPATTTYAPASVAVTTGTYASGNLASITTFNDANAYSVTEVTGVPGYDIRIGFTGVTVFNRVELNLAYTNSSQHVVDVDLYNNSTAAWDTVGVFQGLAGYTQFQLGVIDSTPYVSAGAVQLRLYHVTTGSGTHSIQIDYASLQQATQGPQGPQGDTGATGATGPAGTTDYTLLSNKPTIPLPVGIGSEIQVRSSGTAFAAYAGSGTCAGSNWMTALDASGAKTCTRPAFSDVSGSVASGQLPGAGASQGAIVIGTDLGGTSAAPQVVATHLASALPQAQGGTGATALTCAAGNHLTSNGTAYSCSPDTGGGGAPTTSGYWVTVADAGLSAEQVMGALGTGLVKNTTTTGVPSIYAGTDCGAGKAVQTLDASGAATACNAIPAAGAPSTATYITQTADAGLSGEQALSALSTGIVKVTNGTGVLTTAASGTDYGPPTSGNATGLVLSTTTTGAHTAYGGTSCSGQFPRSLNASGAATCASVALADHTPNLGTTTTVLHGNAAGQPSYAGVTLADFTANQGATTTLLHGNAAGQPSFAAVALGTDVTGTLPVGNGGLGAVVTPAAGTIVYGSSGTAHAELAAGALGQGLYSGGAASPTWANADKLVMLTSDYTNATTSMTNTALTWTSPAVVSRSVFSCDLAVKGSSAGAIAAQLDVTSSVAPTSIVYTLSYVLTVGTPPSTAGTSAVVTATANSTAVGPASASGLATYTMWKLSGVILHTSSASTVTIRGKATATGTATIGQGSACQYGIF